MSYPFTNATKRYTIIAVILIYFLFGFISLQTANIHLDEKESHLPTLNSFFHDGILTTVSTPNYKVANTPLPYIIDTIILKIFSIKPSLYSARLLNMAVSFLTVLILTLLLESKALINFFIPVFFFYPYFLKPSFAYFMSIYGLFFFLIFIYFSFRKDKTGFFISGLSLSLAVLCQQFYLIVLVFYFPILFYRRYKQSELRFIWQELLLFILPFVLPGILFLIWGGLTHPSYAAWGAAFSLKNLTGVLAVLGSCLFPFLIYKIRDTNLKILTLFFVLSFLLVFFYFPLWVSAPTPGGISGYTFHVLSIINSYSSLVGFIAKAFLVFLGISSFYIFYKMISEDKIRLLYIIFIILAFGFTLNQLPSERHLLPLIVCAYLLVFSGELKPSVLRIWLLLQVITGASYFYSIMNVNL